MGFIYNLIRSFQKGDSPMIMPYRGYANKEKIFLRGRVLEDEGIARGYRGGAFRNLLISIKRFESDEIPEAKVGIRMAENYFEILTDKEGYFTLKTTWQQPPLPTETYWLQATVQLLEMAGRATPTQAASEVVISYPFPAAALGIISDIDDTILQTHVTSTLWWKLVYVTFFKNAWQRQPVPGMVELLQALAGGKNGLLPKPVFYVSDSPWNMYDLLDEFMHLQQLPKGPVMLQDYGVFPVSNVQPFQGHKLHTIQQIMETYPDMHFIMLGDTASKDADIYVSLAEAFPGRIETIYIRYLRNTSNARRIARLFGETRHVEAILIRNTQEIYDHARKKGFL